jgi:hypothetical protein
LKNVLGKIRDAKASARSRSGVISLNPFKSDYGAAFCVVTTIFFAGFFGGLCAVTFFSWVFK